MCTFNKNWNTNHSTLKSSDGIHKTVKSSNSQEFKPQAVYEQ